eukprot:TRINITY_DN9008_c0_g1_i1.p1 TRINITY_DN9008_c0_g1~~TRINITY_DN9008_c0_g1_i1.p1  ORF type:complete len:1314 (-),score=156.63 TRINITY_DN9008_c0_g1_i1:182-4084(-)
MGKPSTQSNSQANAKEEVVVSAIGVPVKQEDGKVASKLSAKPVTGTSVDADDAKPLNRFRKSQLSSEEAATATGVAAAEDETVGVAVKDEGRLKTPNAKDPSSVVTDRYVSDGGNHAIKPTSWELFLAGEKWSCCFGCSACWLFFFIGMFWLVVFFVKAQAMGSDIFDLEEATLKSDPIVQQYYGFQAAKRVVDDGCHMMHENKAACEKDNRCYYDEKARRGRGQMGMCMDVAVCPAPPPKNRSTRMDLFFLVYEANNQNQNLLEDSVLDKVYEFEKTLLTTANGAKTKDGVDSPWTNWCMRSYADGSIDGKCAPPQSIFNVFTMNAHGRSKVKTLSGTNPMLNCMCGDVPKLCSFCTTAGTLNPAGLSSLTSCMPTPPSAGGGSGGGGGGGGGGANGSTGSSPSGSNSSMCTVSRSSSVDWKSMCQGMPQCQWSGPGFSMCSSFAYYYPTDSDGVVKGADKDAVIDSLCDDKQMMPFAMAKAMFGAAMDCTGRKARYARTIFFSGANEGGSTEEKDAFTKDYVEHRDGWYWTEAALESRIEQEAGGDLRIMLLSTSTAFSAFLGLLINDGTLSSGSLVMVWLYMWYAMESLLLATCGIFEILMSLPVGLSLWVVILQQRITGLQFLVVFMILGIGADDVFVVFDAWQQSAHAGEEVNRHWVTRFAWAYRRSFSAMLVTTSTTCGSFIIGATSPLPSVQSFCIFAAVVVLVDWLFCITFFASAIVVYEKHFKGVACCCRCIGMETAAPGKVCGPGCCWGVPRAALSCGGTNWKYVDKPPAPNEVQQPRAFERFAVGPFFNFLSGLGGTIVVCGWIILVIGLGVNIAVSLRTAQEPPAIGRPHIDFTRVIEVMITQFPSYRQPTAYAVFGMDMDAAVEFGTSHDKDTPKFSKSGASELITPAGQEKLLALCRAADLGKDADKTRCGDKTCIVEGSVAATACLKDETIWKNSGIHVLANPLCETGRYCFMEEFARFWAAEWGGCRQKKTQPTCTGSCVWDSTLKVCHSPKTEFDYTGLPQADFLSQLSGNEFRAYLERRQKVLSAANQMSEASNYKQMTGFKLNSANDNLEFAYVGWNATYPAVNTVDEANEWYARWEAFFTKHASGLGGYQTTNLYLFMTTQNEMVKSAIMGAVMSLLIAFVVMVVASLNWRTALLGFINVLAITILFLGMIPILGWSLGEYECIFVIACVGLSVDYTLHLLHAYNHAHCDTRKERSRAALGEMGISVFSSALTTLLATSLLFGCGMQFFFQFGGFIFIVILLSIFMSLLFLMPIMMIFGPEYDQGKISLSCLRRKGIPTE